MGMNVFKILRWDSSESEKSMQNSHNMVLGDVSRLGLCLGDAQHNFIWASLRENLSQGFPTK